MSVKNIASKLVLNKKPIIKRTLIIAGTVVGLALTAGLIVKNKNAVESALEPALDVVAEVSAK